MPEVRFEVEGFDELRKKYQKAPEKFDKAIETTMDASLLVLHENVPPYPERESSYVRTGTLGKSFGADLKGGKQGKADIYEVKQEGKYIVGEFGSKLKYAPYVVSETKQARIHQGIWWTIIKIAKNSQRKIEGLFRIAAEELAKWLDENPL